MNRKISDICGSPAPKDVTDSSSWQVPTPKGQRRAGVIGWPVAHSLSPAIFAQWFRDIGLDPSTARYDRIPCQPDALPQLIETLQRLEFQGANVTIPHKQNALALAHTRSDAARAIGAANMLTFRDGLVHADNSDWVGFLDPLDRAITHHARTFPSCACIIGAGGAARGVLYGLLQRNMSEILIVNRTRDRAEALKTDFLPLISQSQARVRTLAFDAIADGDPSSRGLAESPADLLLVQTTSLGMDGQPPLPLAALPLKPDTIVYDLVYRPAQTDLLQRARQSGALTLGGLPMLIRQAIPGFRAWFTPNQPDIEPDVSDSLIQALNQAAA